MKIFEKRIESDFEFFVRSLPALEPVEFLGLAKVLCVPIVRDSEISFNKEVWEKAKDDETIQATIAETLIPADEILEAMMDKYLTLNKKRRGEINQILKEIKKTKKVS